MKNVHKTTEQFIEDAKRAHGDKYDYSKVNYINAKTKVCIICPEHGEFWQNPHLHTLIKNPRGCPKCKPEKLRKFFAKSTEQFIADAKKVHGDEYDYSKADYKNNATSVCIICPEHGEFWQVPTDHINNGAGCPKCNKSKGELKIEKLLIGKNIKFIHDKACLGFLGRMRPDFYLPDYNLVIEYDGEQHFKAKYCFGGEEEFEYIQSKDRLKEKLLKENNVDLIRIPYWELNNIENILNEEIKQKT